MVRGPGDALGVVEVRGMTAALAVLDRMGKAAPVVFAGPALIGDGLVGWFIHGPIAAVQEAVETALLGSSSSSGHVVGVVIGRPDESVVALFGVEDVVPLSAIANQEEGLRRME